MNKTIEYKGYIIRTQFNKKDKEYPYIATGVRGFDEIQKRGYNEEQAIGLVRGLIDFTIAMQQSK